MTLGELITELERLELKYGADVRVMVPGAYGGFEDLVFGCEYSERNDLIAIW